MAPPAVSICIPCYNNESTVHRALESALNQSEVHLEVVVVDDGSSDRTVEIAEAFDDDRLRVVRNARNLGLVGNHNRCIALADGQLIQFLHADDRLLPGAVEALAATFVDGDVALAFAPRLIETNDQAWKARYGALHERFSGLQSVNDGDELLLQFAWAGRAKGNWIGEPSSVMFRADLGRALGGFDDRFVQMLDMEFWARLMVRRRVAWVSEPVAVRSHSSSTASVRNSTAAVAYTDRLLMLTSLVRHRSQTTRVRAAAAVWLTVALVRTAMDAARRDALGTGLRERIRITRWRSRRTVSLRR